MHGHQTNTEILSPDFLKFSSLSQSLGPTLKVYWRREVSRPPPIIEDAARAPGVGGGQPREIMPAVQS